MRLIHDILTQKRQYKRRNKQHFLKNDYFAEPKFNYFYCVLLCHSLCRRQAHQQGTSMPITIDPSFGDFLGAVILKATYASHLVLLGTIFEIYWSTADMLRLPRRRADVRHKSSASNPFALDSLYFQRSACLIIRRLLLFVESGYKTV